MQEKLNLYQQYMLEIIINFIGTQPYIIMASDDEEVLNTCVEEIVKRIDAIKLLYDYPHLYGDHPDPEWLVKIPVREYKNIVLMNFNKMMEERFNSYQVGEAKFKYHVYGYRNYVYDYLIMHREYLRNTSIIVPCSNKVANDAMDVRRDLDSYSQYFYLDKAEEFDLLCGDNEDEIKEKIKILRGIDYNARHNDRIENFLQQIPDNVIGVVKDFL